MTVVPVRELASALSYTWRHTGVRSSAVKGGGHARLLTSLLALALCSCTLQQGGRPFAASAAGVGSDASVYVIRRGWHVDVAFAATDLDPPLETVRSVFPHARFLVLGFGDRHYLLHRGRFSMLGALLPGKGLVLATGLRATPQEAFGEHHVIRLRLSGTQLEALQDFVWHTLSREDAPVSPLAAGPYPGSFYYEATQRYSALHTCNTWAAEALKAAGLPIRTVGAELAQGLWRQVGRVQLEQSSVASVKSLR